MEAEQNLKKALLRKDHTQGLVAMAMVVEYIADIGMQNENASSNQKNHCNDLIKNGSNWSLVKSMFRNIFKNGITGPVYGLAYD